MNYINSESKVVVSGLTGKQGTLHARLMKEYGTKVVAGVTPGKGGIFHEGIPVFDTVEKAVKETGADVSIIFVPPAFAADSIMESSDAGINLCVCITEGIPVIDMLKVKSYLRDKKMKLLGPNCPGIIVPCESKVGIMPGDIHSRGNIGIVSRSGTLTYEAVKVLHDAGFGQSAVIGIGGDPIHGLGFIDVLDSFNQDESTEAVLMIGEIGGSDEEKAADWYEKNMNKKLIAFIGGKTAPKGKRMGHAGAIVSGNSVTAASKSEYLRSKGIPVADVLDDIASFFRD